MSRTNQLCKLILFALSTVFLFSSVSSAAEWNPGSQAAWGNTTLEYTTAASGKSTTTNDTNVLFRFENGNTANISFNGTSGTTWGTAGSNLFAVPSFSNGTSTGTLNLTIGSGNTVAANLTLNTNSSSSSSVNISNYGTINGAVTLTSGNDRFTIYAGSYVSSIAAGSGTDELVLDGVRGTIGNFNSTTSSNTSSVSYTAISGFDNLTVQGGSDFTIESLPYGMNGTATITDAKLTQGVDLAFDSISVTGTAGKTATLDLSNHTMTSRGNISLGGAGTTNINTTVKLNSAGTAIDSMGKLTTTGGTFTLNGNVNVVASLNGNLAASSSVTGKVLEDNDTGVTTNGNTVSLVVGSQSAEVSGTADGSTASVSAGMVNYTLTVDDDNAGTEGYDLTISRKSTTDVAAGIGTTGALNIDGLLAAMGDDTSTLTTASTEQLKKIMDSLDPDTLVGVTTALASADSSSNVVGNRLSSTRSSRSNAGGQSGLSSGSEMLNNKLWGQVFGATMSESSHENISAYDTTTKGMTFGLDTLVSDDLRMGFAYTYTTSDSALDDGSSESEVTSQISTLYGSYTYQRAFFDAYMAYSLDRHETERTVVGFGTAKGDFGGNTFSSGLKAGFDYSLPKDFTLTPSAAVDYYAIDTDDYTETGAGAANLNIDSASIDVFRTTAEMELSYTKDFFTGRAYGAWLHDWCGTTMETSAAFANTGTTLVTEESRRDEDKYSVGLGIDIEATDALIFSLESAYTGSENTDGYSGSVMAKYLF